MGILLEISGWSVSQAGLPCELKGGEEARAAALQGRWHMATANAPRNAVRASREARVSAGASSASARLALRSALLAVSFMSFHSTRLERTRARQCSRIRRTVSTVVCRPMATWVALSAGLVSGNGGMASSFWHHGQGQARGGC